jgi:hypothetical protein
VRMRELCPKCPVPTTVIALLSLLLLAACAGLSRGSNAQFSSGSVANSAFGFDIRNPLVSWPKEPFTWWRLWDAGVDWSRVEPAPNQFDFTLMDKYVALAQEHDVKIIYVISNTPQWAATDANATGTVGTPGGISPPRNMQDWQNYVSTVATRYKGKIAAYEVWNEADLPGYWNGTMQQMVQLCQIAHDTIKKIDPSATVLAPSVVAGQGLTFLPAFFLAGGGQYSDAVAYHMYDTQMAPELSMPFFRDMITVAGQGGKQIWNTEDGWGPWGTWPNDQAAANFVARSLILQRSLGVSVIVWYAWDDRGPWVNLFMVQPDLQTPTPAAVAFGTVTAWLDNAAVACTNLADNWQCSLTSSENGTRYVVWNASGAGTFAIPPSWGVKTMVDLNGNTQSIPSSTISLTGSPVLLK